MEYKKGHKIKPKETSPTGRVIFTDGTNDVSPNQISCEAYGYKWNKGNNTCSAFPSNFKISKLFKNTTNTNIGNNKAEGSTENTFISGQKNTTKGNNRNIIISGENHQVENNIKNASVLGGTYGKVIRQSEVVIGGGEALGRNQTSIVQFAGSTTNNTATDLTIQGDTSSYLAVQNNSILGFEVKVIGLCSGGSSGTAGDYKYIEIKGAVQVDNGYNLTWSQSSTTIASVGTTGTAQMAAVTDPNITVEVTGTSNVNIQWFASVQLTEKKLSTDTF